jgi:NAD(P)-dependent dehydrogenase (short-subunit alcohol dehydrogenase family)
MTRAAPDVEVPDLTGRLAVVTGANSGIGVGLTERALAEADARRPREVSEQLTGAHFPTSAAPERSTS